MNKVCQKLADYKNVKNKYIIFIKYTYKCESMKCTPKKDELEHKISEDLLRESEVAGSCDNYLYNLALMYVLCGLL